MPRRVIPEVSQVAEYSSKCSQSRLSVCGTSHAPRAGFHVAMSRGTEEASHILDDHQSGP
jgi:hypothetical protein